MSTLKKFTDSQLKDKLRQLTDKMEDIYEKILYPNILEFDHCKQEFVSIIDELEERGILNKDG